MRNHYRVLGILRTATASEVKAAYRAKARERHPDVGGTAAAFSELTEAYEILSDGARRAAWEAEYAAWATANGAVCCPECHTAQRVRPGGRNRCPICRCDLASVTPIPSRLATLRDDLAERAGDFIIDVGARVGDELADVTISAVDRGLSTLEQHLRGRRRRR